MKSITIGSGSELVRLMACSFVGAFLLFSTVGCEQETGAPTDVISNEGNSEVVDAAVYVDASIGSDDYDGSSLTCRGNGVGPKKTIQAGVDITPQNRICYVMDPASAWSRWPFSMSRK